jgi:hypothetical protein
MIEIIKGRNCAWFRVLDADHKVIVVSQEYPTAMGARRAVQRLLFVMKRDTIAIINRRDDD